MTGGRQPATRQHRTAAPTAYRDLSFPHELYQRDGSFANSVQSFLNLTPRALELFFQEHRRRQAQDVGGGAVIAFPREVTVTTVSTVSSKIPSRSATRTTPVPPSRRLEMPMGAYQSVLSLASSVDESIETLPFDSLDSDNERERPPYIVTEPDSVRGSAASLVSSSSRGEPRAVARAARSRGRPAPAEAEHSAPAALAWEAAYLDIVERVRGIVAVTDLWVSARAEHRLPVASLVRTDCARLKRAVELVIELRSGPRLATPGTFAVCGATGGAALVGAGLVQRAADQPGSLLDSAAQLISAPTSVARWGLSALLASVGVGVAVQQLRASSQRLSRERQQAAYEANYIVHCREWRDRRLHAERVQRAFGRPVVHDALPDGPRVPELTDASGSSHNHVRFSGPLNDSVTRHPESPLVNARMGEELKKHRPAGHSSNSGRSRSVSSSL